MSATLVNVTMTAGPTGPPAEMQVAVVRPSAENVLLTLNASNGTVTVSLGQDDAAGLAQELTQSQ